MNMIPYIPQIDWPITGEESELSLVCKSLDRVWIRTLKHHYYVSYCDGTAGVQYSSIGSAIAEEKEGFCSPKAIILKPANTAQDLSLPAPAKRGRGRPKGSKNKPKALN